ncbi:hypothetical protein CBS101457_000099 [Exobasidium rhododendri]|nr:hypothetical protein CBS101457_000099 [Exobasidium rhododendri]
MHIGDMSLAGLQHSTVQATPTQEGKMSAHVARLNDKILAEHAKEYTIPVDKDFPRNHLGDSVYMDLSRDQKALVIDRIQQIRPFSPPSIRKKLGRHLSAPIAKAILSDDETAVEAAVEELIPINQAPERTAHPPWMTGLSNTQRKVVILKLAAATEQRTEELRDFFLNRHVTPEVAKKILHADIQECKMIAYDNNLILKENERNRPWQRGVSQNQRKALLHRMMTKGGVKNNILCYEYLERYYVPRGYGLKMLRADDKTFMEIMEWLRGTGFPPSPV